MDFRTVEGGLISTIVSPGRNDRDLYLTFYFEWPFPNIEAGSADAKEMSERVFPASARWGVQMTVDEVRAIVQKAEVGTAQIKTEEQDLMSTAQIKTEEQDVMSTAQIKTEEQDVMSTNGIS